MSYEIVPMNDIIQMANAVAKSGLFGVKSPDQALALMLVAQAEGRHPALAARDYDIISGRPAKKTEAMLRDFLENQGKVEWHQLDDTIADATFSHPAGGTIRISWDMKRAAMAGLQGRDMWKKYPRQMLRSRCVSEGIRSVCPMATSGMYDPSEVADMVKEKDITPKAGAIDAITQEQATRMDELAAKMHAWLAQGSVGDALVEMDNAAPDAEEKTYLWTKFDSKQRAAMKKYVADAKREKQIAALKPADPVAAMGAEGPAEEPTVDHVAVAASSTISAAQHRRLEARINEVGIEREKVKKYVAKHFKREHLTELNQDEYDTIDAMLDDHAAKHPKAAQPADPADLDDTSGGILTMESDAL